MSSRREPDGAQRAELSRLGAVGWAQWDRAGRILRAVAVLAVSVMIMAAVSVVAVGVAHAPTVIVVVADLCVLAMDVIIVGAFALYPERATRAAVLGSVPRMDELAHGRGVGWGGVPDPVEPAESDDHLERRVARQAETLAKQRADLLADLPSPSGLPNDLAAGAPVHGVSARGGERIGLCLQSNSGQS